MPSSGKRRPAGATGRRNRACDNCHEVHARWHCEADDAFLCQRCDADVHSANSLASRHRRVRINAPSINSPAPSWHQGIKRKPRTPRPNHRGKVQCVIHCVSPSQSGVPDLESSVEVEDDSQLLYRVPIFDHDLVPNQETQLQLTSYPTDITKDGGVAFLPSEVELTEFAADMQSLLAPESGCDSFCIEELGLPDSTATAPIESYQEIKMHWEANNAMEPLELNFDCEEEYKTEKIVGLMLDYEAVIAEWSSHDSPPWTEEQSENGYSWMEGGMSHAGAMEVAGGREARVSRYREKRRTRLFAKKIRYEVRKLNAEKRPRMKGRFVKRPATAT